MNKEFEIKYKKQNKIYDARVILYRISTGETLLKYIDDSGEQNFSNVHVFVSFCNLREKLEKDGKVLLCKGCRTDVHPSGSQLKWIFAYKLLMNRRINPNEDEVMLFEEEEDINRIGSVKEQNEYYKEWLKSIEGLPYNILNLK